MAFTAFAGEWYYVDANGQRHKIMLKGDMGFWAKDSDLVPKPPSQSSESKKLAEYDVIDQQDDEESNAG